MDQRCVDDNFAERCAGLCGVWCKRDRAYFLAHEAFCLSQPVFAGTAVDSDPVCATENESTASSLRLCLQEARSNARSLEQKLSTLEDAPDIVAGLREFIEGVPDCAPDAPSLLRMFDCLKAEGGLISTEFTQLDEKGYTTLTDFEQLCEIPRQEMSTDVKLAKGLKGRAEQLQNEFNHTNACKENYETWANDLSDKDARRSGGGLLQQWIEKTRADLKPAEETARNLDHQLSAINTQMTSILKSIQYGLVLCP
ncbi:hypothetical protein [Candidatus Thiosymbion oneisti]|uniref:hypothetical protein n=1 Tax=Candidatus Thiosymbion oneisti TaxID=589554 RepID=UPI00105EAE86|nr:hypothetical protein [Candidatus Thiosymbion oneisti]